MSESPELSRSPETDPAPASPADSARAQRLEAFRREQVIVDHLNRGVTVPEIAARVGVDEPAMRVIVRQVLARRMPESPEVFAAIQMSRLNEAMLVAFSAMTDMNLKAVDRVIRIARELDRCHKALAARPMALDPERDAEPSGAAAAMAALLAGAADAAGEGGGMRNQNAPQSLEKIDSGSQNSPAPGASPAGDPRPSIGEGRPDAHGRPFGVWPLVWRPSPGIGPRAEEASSHAPKEGAEPFATALPPSAEGAGRPQHDRAGEAAAPVEPLARPNANRFRPMHMIPNGVMAG